MFRRSVVIALTLTSLLLTARLEAETVVLLPGDDLQAAIDAAQPDDELHLLPGEYLGDITLGGKQIRIVGSGGHSVLRGTGGGPVVTIDESETPLTVLDSLTITGGVALRGGGVFIDGSSPTLVRCRIVGNQSSSQGSGVWIGGGSNALLFNNLIAYNTRVQNADPHGIQIVSASPAVINNTIVRHDSNGILISGSSEALIQQNVIAWNGAVVGGTVRGRGICDFSIGSWIINNDFHRNRRSALLRGGKDWKRLGKFQKQNPDHERVFDNVDGNPGFRGGAPKQLEAVDCFDLQVCDQRKGRAIDAGIDDPDSRDLDGSRNTIGHTGGPFAEGSLQLPSPNDALPPG
ncbi:MAG: hypothetical protein DHS20C15_03030 [Planctomycetota bacterium]|nr:MAG: hypothetical protein DHS20C15_03030 [Planctomycetota bacterium]